MAARREGRPLVRALDLDSGEERLIDPASDTLAAGPGRRRARRATMPAGASRIDGRTWFLTVYHMPWEIVMIGRGAYRPGPGGAGPARPDIACG